LNVSRSIADNPSQAGQRHDNATVLIVDDEPESIRLMLETLARRGISPQVACDRRAAIELTDRNRCDLAFISMRLGDAAEQCSGLDLADEIRRLAPEMPIIITADAQCRAAGDSLLHLGTQAAVKAIRAGCRDFLLKPLSRQTMERVLDALLPNRAVATAAAAQQGDRCLTTWSAAAPSSCRA